MNYLPNLRFANVTGITKKNYYFQNRFSLKQRIKQSSDLFTKKTDIIPVIVESHSNKFIFGKHKYLKLVVPKIMTVAELIDTIKKHTKNDETLLCAVINNSIPQAFDILENVYKKHKNNDGFLYVACYEENAFG